MQTIKKICTDEAEVRSVELDSDKIYRRINSTGRWQITLYAIYGIAYISHAWQYLGFLFIGG